MHRWNAKRRGIEFTFTREAWWAWWQVDGRWENRGIGQGRYVMARFGDVGPYSEENVYCATHAQNTADVPFEARSKASLQGWSDPSRVSPLKIRGDGHPKSRAVMTPVGRFGSAALASDHFGISRQYAATKARKGLDGWSYEAL